jgi:hypothetical protein
MRLIPKSVDTPSTWSIPKRSQWRGAKRTVMTIGMLAPPHENGRGPGEAELA